MVLLDGAVVNRDPRIVDGFVYHAKRIGLRRPLEVIDRLRPVSLPAGVDLIDGDHFARLRLGDQFLVVEPPPGGRIAAERLARMGRVGAGPRLDVHDSHFEYVAQLGAAHIDWTGADMHAEALAGATAQQLTVHRTCAASIHAFLVLRPQVHAFGAGIAFDHPLGIVVGVVCQCLDGHVVTGIDLELGLEQLAEIAPVNCVGCRRKVVIGWLTGSRRGTLSHGRRDQRSTGCTKRCRSSRRHEGALKKGAPLGVEIVEKPLAVQFEFGATAIITCAHCVVLPNRE